MPATNSKSAKRKRSNSSDSEDSNDDKKPAASEPIALDKAPIQDLEAPEPAVYFPDFYPEIPSMTQEELKAKEWLTPGMFL